MVTGPAVPARGPPFLFRLDALPPQERHAPRQQQHRHAHLPKSRPNPAQHAVNSVRNLSLLLGRNSQANNTGRQRYRSGDLFDGGGPAGDRTARLQEEVAQVAATCARDRKETNDKGDDMTKLNDLKVRFMEDPEFREEYARVDDEYALIGAQVRARTAAKLTQAEPARPLGTTQSAVERP